MPANNIDKSLPQTPAVGVRPSAAKTEEVEDKTPILTNNFNEDSPTNPILWGPKQPWVGINSYEPPTNWRNKELLSIPRVVRFLYAVSDPCDHTGDGGGGCVTTRLVIGFNPGTGESPDEAFRHVDETWCSCDDADIREVQIGPIGYSIFISIPDGAVSPDPNTVFASFYDPSPVPEGSGYDTPVITTGGAC